MSSDETKELLLQRRALVADLRTVGGDRLTRVTIEAQIKMIDQRLIARQNGGRP